MKYTGQLLVRLVTLGLLSAQRNFWVSDDGQFFMLEESQKQQLAAL